MLLPLERNGRFRRGVNAKSKVFVNGGDIIVQSRSRTFGLFGSEQEWIIVHGNWDDNRHRLRLQWSNEHSWRQYN